ncbi:hypothetical protein L596_014842 [Steinernema carpocapsae]|nr:hypothetical protein L596_014842 [Steinernema carpocapsae]
MVALSPTLETDTLNSSVDQLEKERQKRQEWRQARLKSLDAESARAEEVMLKVQQINSRLGNISEDHSGLNSPMPLDSTYNDGINESSSFSRTNDHSAMAKNEQPAAVGAVDIGFMDDDMEAQ